jgi:hypothetical protein
MQPRQHLLWDSLEECEDNQQCPVRDHITDMMLRAGFFGYVMALPSFQAGA